MGMCVISMSQLSVCTGVWWCLAVSKGCRRNTTHTWLYMYNAPTLYFLYFIYIFFYFWKNHHEQYNRHRKKNIHHHRKITVHIDIERKQSQAIKACKNSHFFLCFCIALTIFDEFFHCHAFFCHMHVLNKPHWTNSIWLSIFTFLGKNIHF